MEERTLVYIYTLTSIQFGHNVFMVILLMRNVASHMKQYRQMIDDADITTVVVAKIRLINSKV